MCYEQITFRSTYASTVTNGLLWEYSPSPLSEELFWKGLSFTPYNVWARLTSPLSISYITLEVHAGATPIIFQTMFHTWILYSQLKECPSQIFETVLNCMLFPLWYHSYYQCHIYNTIPHSRRSNFKTKLLV